MKRYKFKYEKNRSNLRKLRGYYISKGKKSFFKRKKLISIFKNPDDIFNFFNRMEIPFVVIKNGEIFYANRAFCDFFEYEDVRDVLGKKIYEFVTPEFKEVVFKKYLKRIKGESKFVRYFAKGKTKNGNVVSGYVDGYVFNVKGQKYLVSFVYSKTAEISLRDELRLFKSIIENLPLSVVVTNTIPEIEYVNSYFEELTGYSFREVHGENPNILKSGLTPQETYESLWGNLINGEKWEGEFINKKKNGEFYREKAIIYPIRDGELKYVGIKSDITEEKEHEEYRLNDEILNKVGHLSTEISYFLRDLEQSLQILIALKNGGEDEIFDVSIGNILEKISRFRNRVELFSEYRSLKKMSFSEALRDVVNEYAKKYKKMEVLGEFKDMPDFSLEGFYIEEIFHNVHLLFNEKLKGSGKFYFEAKRCTPPCDEGALTWEEIKRLKRREYVLLKFIFPEVVLSEKDFNLGFNPSFYSDERKTNIEITFLYLIAEKLKGAFFVKNAPVTFYLFIPIPKSVKEKEYNSVSRIIVIGDIKDDFSRGFVNLLRSLKSDIFFKSLKVLGKEVFNPSDKVILVGDIDSDKISEVLKYVDKKNVLVISKNETVKEKFPAISFLKYRSKFYYLFEKLKDWI